MTAREGRIRQYKGLDQYFLVDRNYLNAEFRLAQIGDRDVVLEIGAGDGALTKLISGKAKRVIAVEKDPRFASHLISLGLGNVEVVCADALELELPAFDKVMGNLPYSISTPLTFKLLPCSFELGVLAYQYEFAKRMVSRPGEAGYSRLSVVVALMTAEVELCFRVPRNAFRPIPEVDSGVIRIIPRPHHQLDELSKQVIRMVFCHKRKTLTNAIRNSKSELRSLFGIDSEQILREVDAPWNRRVFRLSPKEALALGKSVGKLLNGPARGAQAE